MAGFPSSVGSVVASIVQVSFSISSYGFYMCLNLAVFKVHISFSLHIFAADSDEYLQFVLNW